MTEALDNPIWHALSTEHAHLAVAPADTSTSDRSHAPLQTPQALRYPADIVPVAGLAANTPAALAELRELLAPHELIWIAAESLPPFPGLELLEPLPCLQMIYRPDAATASVENSKKLSSQVSPHAPPIEKLSPADAPAMVALTDAAFPGFFRPRTYLMGDYFGICNSARSQLIAMAGNRLAIPGARELSAVVTLPTHAGQGLAARLIARVLAEHAAASLGTFLHVATSNHRAIALYQRLGFQTRRILTLQHLRRA